MLSLGQLTHLPEAIAANPFYRPIVKFSRYKTGSFEALFAMEAFILRYSWVGLLILLALVLPPLEEIDGLSTLVRYCTLLYPAFFVWSLTRVSGVELVQLMLEGRWTAEILAAPLSERDLTCGFITPLWMVVRQYILISIFSLALYNLETTVIVRIDDHLYLDELFQALQANFTLFFGVVAWIIFIYLARLLIEVRLRNGLLKGLFTLLLMLAGVGFFLGYFVLIFSYPALMTHRGVLLGINLFSVVFVGAGLGFHGLLRRNFRRYMGGQLDIDPLIFDRTDPQASAWQKIVSR